MINEKMSQEQAKQFFVSMGCSHFHMFRENPARFEAYQQLNISKQDEMTWRKEQFNQYYNDLLRGVQPDEISMFFSSMADLAIALNSNDSYMKMLEVSDLALQQAPDGYRVVVAESIIGRAAVDARSGLVFHSYDFGAPQYAAKFAGIAIKLARSDMEHSLSRQYSAQERAHNAINTCRTIISKLELTMNCP